MEGFVQRGGWGRRPGGEAPYAGEARGKPSGGRFGLRPQPGTLHR